MTEVCMGTVTFQFQCSSESTNGTGVQGGQIPEIIFYGPSNDQPQKTSTLKKSHNITASTSNANAVENATVLPSDDDGEK